MAPEMIAKDLLMLGTIEKKTWQQGLARPPKANCRDVKARR